MRLELSEATAALAERVAAVQKVTVDEAIRRALEQHVAQSRAGREPSGRAGITDERRARIDGLLQRLDALPDLDARTPDQIMDDINAP